MKIEFNWPDSVPTTEFSTEFIQGMLDRVAQAFFKYGTMADAYPNRIDALSSLQKRLNQYERTGNKEWLMDAGNFLMIEFKYPRHPKAHFRATSTTESPGRKWHGEVDTSARGNLDG